MAELKTKLNDASAEDFIGSVDDQQKQADAFALLEMFKEVTGEPAKMWGPSIVGFGQYHYKSERSTQEGDWMLTGFSPRKAALTLYLTMSGYEKYADQLGKLGKHKTGKGCLYINKLSDVDQGVLKDLIKDCYADMQAQHVS